MKLDDVQIVGLHAPQALVHGVYDVLPAVVVQTGQRDTEPRALARGKPGHVQGAAALGGKEELLTAAGDAPADVLFGFAVVHGDVNVVDTGVQDSVEDALRLAWRERPADTSDHATQLQGADAKGGHVQARN